MTTPIVMAKYLADRTAAIAGLEAAGECFGQIHDLIERIGNVINRPHPRKICGECLHVDENQNGCEEIIWANHDDIEVTCRRCGTLYNVEELIKKSLASAPQFELLYTSSEVLEKMEEMGQPISERTWRWWRANGKITPRSEWDCEQRFQLNDVIKLRNKQNAA